MTLEQRRCLWALLAGAATGMACSLALAGELPPAPSVAPPLHAPPAIAPQADHQVLLHAGETVTMRVLQVIPGDGLSPGERLLGGINPILAGDHFLAEVLEPARKPWALVGGMVTKVVPAGWFGRAGYLNLQMAQLVQGMDGSPAPALWGVDTKERSRTQRAMLKVLLCLEGADVGASLGAQIAPGNPAWIGGSAGIGLILGVGYAALQRGSEPVLEPGDTFQVIVGTVAYKPISRELRTILYPASDPGSKKGTAK